ISCLLLSSRSLIHAVEEDQPRKAGSACVIRNQRNIISAEDPIQPSLPPGRPPSAERRRIAARLRSVCSERNRRQVYGAGRWGRRLSQSWRSIRSRELLTLKPFL